jgi:hypothetical protein
MKSRLTTWLSLLLVVSAAFGLPVTRGVTARVVVEIVLEQRERRVESTPAVPQHPPARVFVAGDPSEAPASLLLDHSLFQRPPPAA